MNDLSAPQTKPVTLPRRYPSAPLVGVAAAVFDDIGRILLVKRGKPPSQGKWGLPGGLLDLGEKLIDGAAREVREECGIEVEVKEVVGVFEPIVRDATGLPEYHYIVIDYWAKYLSGEAVAGDDADEVVWAAMDALDEYELTNSLPIILDAYQAWLQDRAI